MQPVNSKPGLQGPCLQGLSSQAPLWATYSPEAVPGLRLGRWSAGSEASRGQRPLPGRGSPLPRLQPQALSVRGSGAECTPSGTRERESLDCEGRGR
ncbi:hypothetical protein CapIbe_007397 [Capra ibex]